jgi:hypothetical protein
MSVLDRPENVPVRLGYCPCEGTPHEDGDVVYLYPELSVSAGVRARSFFANGAIGDIPMDEVEVRIAELWLEIGVADWTFVYDDGSPIPVTHENIVRALPYAKGGREVADKADDLYVESVTSPLVKRLSELSQRGPTPSGRSQTSRPTTSTKRRRSPSSTATTARAPQPG